MRHMSCSTKSLYFKAVVFATKKHASQKTKFRGQPYIYHPIRVSETVSRFCDRSEVLSAAVLQDVLEQTDTSVDELLESFGPIITDLVIHLTNDSEKIGLIGKPECIRQKIAALPLDALLIKLADKLEHVGDIAVDKKEGPQAECRKNYIEQTLLLLSHIVETRMDMKDYHRKLIDEINVKIQELDQ